MQYFSTNFKLGILGGGQLGKMMLSECVKFDIYCIVLDPNEDAPCSNLASEINNLLYCYEGNLYKQI